MIRQDNNTSTVEFAAPVQAAGSTDRIKAWIAATRPRTLSASIVPVMLGTALAARQGDLRLATTILTLGMAIFIQIGTNLANDYYDFIRGADGDDRLGPQRASQSGAIPATTVRNAAYLALVIAGGCSAALIEYGGLPIAVIGVVSVICAIAYTAGPYPLAYHGLGDLFVFIFFGPVAVGGTYYLQTGTIDVQTLAAAIPLSCLSTAIMAVNNLRDISSDLRAGKRTLAVRIGDRATRWEYTVLVSMAFAVQGVLVGTAGLAYSGPLFVAPLAVFEVRKLWRREGSELNASLGSTAKLLLAFGVAAVIGLSVSSST
jgi:1,4-dihydroxy-2-naphthoate octaprenyltransferase